MLVARRPSQQTVDLAAALRGRWHGSYAMCICPAHDDCSPSLSVRQGDRGILVHCFAGCRSEAVLKAIAQISPLGTSVEPSFAISSKATQFTKIWNQSRHVKGSLGETYLIHRDLPVDLVDVRFHPRCPFGSRPRTAFRPALIVALRSGDRLVAIQRTILRSDGHGHRGRFMLGHPDDGAWAPPIAGSVLAIAEGMEDAAAYSSMRGITCWSSMGSGRLASIRIPAHIQKLYIAQDNDRAGRLAARAAHAAYQRPGLSIITDPPPRPFKDWAAARAGLARSAKCTERSLCGLTLSDPRVRLT